MIEYIGFKTACFLARILPDPLLFLFSDFLYLVLYKIAGYRKKTVRHNLELVFPGKSPQERRQIERRFYRHLADMFVETFKFYALPAKKLKKRLTVTNPGVLNDLYQQGQSVILAGAHVGNWELGPLTAPFWFKHQTIVLYKPLKNKLLDKEVKRLRSRTGTKMISIGITARSFMNTGRPYSVVMLSDQNPSNPDKAIWVKFFGIPTPVLHGLEMYSRRYRLPVVYFDMDKVKRGHYRVTLEVLVPDPQNTQKGEITYRYMKRVEKAISEKPHLWLWSHRRWKHRFDPAKYKVYEF